MFTAVLYSHVGLNGNNANILLFGLYGCLAGIVATYIHGFFLRLHYIDKAKFIDTDDEKNEDGAQRNLFIFYFWTFLWFLAGNTIFIWQMSLLYSDSTYSAQLNWVYSFLIAIGLDWLIFDPICVLLAGIPMFRSIFKWKGYIYERE